MYVRIPLNVLISWGANPTTESEMCHTNVYLNYKCPEWSLIN